MSKRKKIAAILVTVVFVIIILGGITFSKLVSEMKKGEETLASMDFTNIDISTIQNGTYIGDFKAGLIYAKLAVTINNDMIADIKILEHKNGRGSLAESIVDDMIENQTTDVDTVSGATASSKVIKKAAENALTGK